MGQSNRRNSAPPGAAFGDALAAAFARKGMDAPVRTRSLIPGDVVFLDLEQSLSPNSQHTQVRSKRRPFIVLDRRAEFPVDHHDACIQPVRLIGVTGTSKNYLAEGRPHVPFQIPSVPDLTTYALVDTLRTVTVNKGAMLKPCYHMQDHELFELAKGLNATLCPEPRFYLRDVFKRNCLPGQIWEVNAIGLPPQAMILLRRGRFQLDDGADHNAHPFKNTPYLVACFSAEAARNSLRGAKWEDIGIHAIHENAFVRRTGELTPATVGMLLNLVREKITLPRIEYKALQLRSSMNILGAFFSRMFPALGR